MTAVDTNILIRLLTGDDPVQTQAAERVMASGAIWIAKTVLLETAWVLRAVYSFDDRAVGEAVTKLLGLPNVEVEDEPSIAAALALMVWGLDFADAIHLSSRPEGARFVTFDRSLVRRAQRAGTLLIASVPVES